MIDSILEQVRKGLEECYDSLMAKPPPTYYFDTPAALLRLTVKMGQKGHALQMHTVDNGQKRMACPICCGDGFSQRYQQVDEKCIPMQCECCAGKGFLYLEPLQTCIQVNKVPCSVDERQKMRQNMYDALRSLHSGETKECHFEVAATYQYLTLVQGICSLWHVPYNEYETEDDSYRFSVGDAAFWLDWKHLSEEEQEGIANCLPVSIQWHKQTIHYRAVVSEQWTSATHYNWDTMKHEAYEPPPCLHTTQCWVMTVNKV